MEFIVIEVPTTLTTSGQQSHYFGPSPSFNIDTASIQTVNSYIRTRQKSICK